MPDSLHTAAPALPLVTHDGLLRFSPSTSRPRARETRSHVCAVLGPMMFKLLPRSSNIDNIRSIMAPPFAARVNSWRSPETLDRSHRGAAHAL
eukprot:2362429-Pyramimonas_sp.AAC.1